MGCCLGTAAAAAQDHPKPPPSKSPPPSVDAETVVKEVLSETPKPINHTQNDFGHVKTTDPVSSPPAFFPGIQQYSAHARHVLDREPLPSSDPIQIHQQISQVLSEICRFTGKPADEPSSHDYYGYRATPSPSKSRQPGLFSSDPGGRTERVVGKSPSRRLSDQSPGRKNGPARALQCGGEASQAVTKTGLRTEPSSANRSGRRSRSPALRSEAGPKRSNNVGRSTPERRINQSPGRVRTGSPNNCRTKESLENPLVSMECFIFL